MQGFTIEVRQNGTHMRQNGTVVGNGLWVARRGQCNMSEKIVKKRHSFHKVACLVRRGARRMLANVGCRAYRGVWHTHTQ
jgi:hypothetical protein